MEELHTEVRDLQLENSQLSWKEQQLLYRDMPADNDNYRPVAFDAKISFYLENEKSRFEYIPTYYDFASDKLTRTLYLKISILLLLRKSGKTMNFLEIVPFYI